MRVTSLFLGATVAVCLTVVSGCGDDDGVGPGVDAGGADAGSGGFDGGPRDAGPRPQDTVRDAGGSTADAGPATDGGGSMGDAGPATDGGGSMGDAGPRTDGGMCTPVLIDPSHVGDSCSPTVACPTDYVCFGLSGVVLSYSCEIPCVDACDCPATTACTTVTDKAGAHHFCR